MLSLTLLRSYWPLLVFGWLMSFCSSFGQTYFISIFGGTLREEFALSHSAYGTCYAIGTVSSACALIWAGRLIDSKPLAHFSVAAICGLAAAMVGLTLAANWVALSIVFFGLRFFGQGLATHTAMTAMGRYFSKERGRAVSFAGLGHVSGEAVLPIAAVAMLSVLDWRGIWRTGALALVACGIPLILWLLRCARIGPPPGLAAGAAAPSPSGSTQERAGVSLKEALRDPGLYMRLPVLMASSFIITGLIFHQVHIGEQKGWGLELLASGLSVNAAGALAMMILAGGLIDRFSAVKIVPYCLAPMTLACISLAMLDNVFGALLFFALLGIGWGLTAVMIGTIWAELYGVTHLGAIRAFAAALNVFASGLAPPILGVLLDWQMTAEAIAAACATYCVSAAGLSMLAPKVPLYLRLQR